jgi:hypothetical protein
MLEEHTLWHDEMKSEGQRGKKKEVMVLDQS